MIVGITGSQGCGKTTVLHDLKAAGYDVDIFSTPRAVQAKLGYSSLAEVLDQSFDKIKYFQEVILETKYNRDSVLALAHKDDVVFVERTFADIFAYATTWATQLPKKSEEFTEWVNTEYFNKCKAAQLDLQYNTVILSPLETFEPDLRRANEATRFIVDRQMHAFLDLLTTTASLTYHEISDLDRANRITKIQELI